MSFNLKDELARLSQTAPRLKESDEEFSDEDTKARILGASKDFEDELDVNISDNKRLRAGIADLSEYGKRYKGKSVSRKDLDEYDEDLAKELIGDEEDEEDDDEDGDEEDEDGEEGSDEDVEDEGDEEDEASDDDDEEGEEEDDDEDDDEEIDSEDEGKAKNIKKASKAKKEESENGLKVVNVNQKEEAAKGKAVKNQLNFWDSLLDTRVKLQNCLNVANQLPQHDAFGEVITGFDKTQQKEVKSALKENQSYLLKSLNQLAELQQRLFSLDSETSYMIEQSKDAKKSLKRKRSGSVDDDDEEIDSDEANGKEKDEEDDDDEEIYSDTDEENAANERKRLKKSEESTKEFNFKPLEPKKIEEYLSKVNKNFQKYRNATIQKWYDKTRLVTGKSFESFEKPIMQQIEHLLMDKERIVRRTQLKRSIFTVCAKKEELKIEKLEDLKDRNIKDYDAEIFDDQDFYNQLLRELIDRKSYDVSDPVELSRRAIELQKLRSKSKKVVDTKASKGRKIKFTVHKPLVNFMAPMFRCQVPEETRNELFNSLFGGHITMSTSNSNATNQANGSGQEVELQDLFKSF